MKDKDHKICLEIKNILNKEFDLVEVRLFGSRARGKGNEYSDLDIYIEVEKLNKKIKNKIRDIVWEIGLKYEEVISPLIFSRYDIEKSPLKSSSIVQNILLEGIAV